MYFVSKKISTFYTKPEKFYEKIRTTPSILLQSGLNGHFSFIGYDPVCKFIAREKSKQHYEVTIQQNNLTNCFNLSANETLNKLSSLYKDTFKDFSKRNNSNIASAPFVGGLMGFFSYDFGARLNNIAQHVKDDVSYPSAWFIIPKKIIIFDHKKNTIRSYSWAEQESLAKEELQKLERMLKIKNTNQTISSKKRVSSPHINSNVTLTQYINKIRSIKEYLKKGHTYQVNFSQRFSAHTNQNPSEIYKKITTINPSQYQGYIQGDNFSVICNSPERLLKAYKSKNQHQRIIETRPIKGTMPRSTYKTKDQAFRLKLMNSQKDKAELAMIVDLARNDIGKICKAGTVTVNENRIIEGYSHVWHTLSNIRGILEDNVEFPDVIKALFPGGSITGCPKKRTMEIIDELEDYKRGVYTGSLGYICVNGNMDFNIMIRTMFYKKKQIYFHSGGGIVIDSDPKKEYEETINKAQALMESIANV